MGSTLRGPGFGNFDNPYYSPSGSTLYNPNLVWETTVNRNAGLDFDLFKSRITGSLDFYYNTTKDLLLQSAIPSNTGFSTQWNNIGTTSNKGVELGLSLGIIEHRDYFLNAQGGRGRGNNARTFGSNRKMPNLDITEQEAKGIIAFLKWMSSIDTNGFPYNFKTIESEE